MKKNFLKSLIFFAFLVLLTHNAYSQTSTIYATVRLNGAKLTETEKSNSEVLKVLYEGEKLELLEILFANSYTPRFRVKYQNMEGFITSDFIKSNKETDIGIRALKEIFDEKQARIKEQEKLILEKNRIVQEKNRLAEDSLRKIVKKQESLAYEAEIVKNDSIADAMLKNIKTQNRSQNQQYLSQRREKFQNKYGKEVGEKIATKKIWIGMTEAMLLDSWGKPDDINQTVTKYSNSKQYVYGSSQYVYVESGVVTAYQN